MIDVDVTLPAGLTPTVSQTECTASIHWLTSNSQVRIIGHDLAALRACVDAMQAAITAAHRPAHECEESALARAARIEHTTRHQPHAPAESIPVRAVLSDNQARLETADGVAVAVIRSTIVGGRAIAAGDTLVTYQLPSGAWCWRWVGWPAAADIDRGHSHDLGGRRYLVTVVGEVDDDDGQAEQPVPVRAVLDHHGYGARIETVDGHGIGHVYFVLADGQHITPGDTIVVRSGDWKWAELTGWPSAAEIDRGHGVDLGGRRYLVTVVDGEEGE